MRSTCVLVSCMLYTSAQDMERTGSDLLTTVPAQDDSVYTAEKSDTLATITMPPKPSEEKVEKIHRVRRDFNYRQQVSTALAMMGFIAIILTTVQSWNPD